MFARPTVFALLATAVNFVSAEIPADCYTTGPGSQYGNQSIVPTILPDGNGFNTPTTKLGIVTPARSNIAAGDSFTFNWIPAPCHPEAKFAIGSFPYGDDTYPTIGNVYSTQPFIGSTLLNLGGHEGNSSATLIFTGDGFVTGDYYKVILFEYNFTTGTAGPIVYGFDFRWGAEYESSVACNECQ